MSVLFDEDGFEQLLELSLGIQALQFLFPGAPKTLEDCYSLFFLDHTCSIEELRAAYTTTVKRYSDKIENIREIDRAYYRILRDLKEADARVREYPGDAPGLSRYLLNLENCFGPLCLHKRMNLKVQNS